MVPVWDTLLRSRRRPRLVLTAATGFAVSLPVHREACILFVHLVGSVVSCLSIDPSLIVLDPLRHALSTLNAVAPQLTLLAAMAQRTLVLAGPGLRRPSRHGRSSPSIHCITGFTRSWHACNHATANPGIVHEAGASGRRASPLDATMGLLRQVCRHACTACASKDHEWIGVPNEPSWLCPRCMQRFRGDTSSWGCSGAESTNTPGYAGGVRSTHGCAACIDRLQEPDRRLQPRAGEHIGLCCRCRRGRCHGRRPQALGDPSDARRMHITNRRVALQTFAMTTTVLARPLPRLNVHACRGGAREFEPHRHAWDGAALQRGVSTQTPRLCAARLMYMHMQVTVWLAPVRAPSRRVLRRVLRRGRGHHLAARMRRARHSGAGRCCLCPPTGTTTFGGKYQPPPRRGGSTLNVVAVVSVAASGARCGSDVNAARRGRRSATRALWLPVATAAGSRRG